MWEKVWAGVLCIEEGKRLPRLCPACWANKSQRIVETTRTTPTGYFVLAHMPTKVQRKEYWDAWNKAANGKSAWYVLYTCMCN